MKLDTNLNESALAAESFTKRDMLEALLEAKARSDVRDYGSKANILRKLLRAKPGEFAIDSQERNILGLTHEPTRFKIHMLQEQMPDGVSLKRLAKSASYPEDWQVATHLHELLATSGEPVFLLKVAAAALAKKYPCDHQVWYDVDRKQVLLSCEKESLWRPHLEKLAEVISCQEANPDTAKTLIKRAYSPLARGVTDVMGLTPGPANAWYGGPRPLAATLMGGLLGGGLGYMGGRLAEGGMGKMFVPGALPKLATLFGALGGAAPGLAWGYHNYSREGMPGLTRPGITPDPYTPGLIHSPVGYKTDEQKQEEARQDAREGLNPEGLSPKSASFALRQLFPDCQAPDAYLAAAANYSQVKEANLQEPINVDAFGRVIWSKEDPFTPPAIRAATMGLLDAASMQRGDSPLVGIGDIARVASGMGSGYLAATAAKTLGAMAGLSQEAQNTLQQSGIWAGFLKATVPGIFGG